MNEVTSKNENELMNRFDDHLGTELETIDNWEYVEKFQEWLKTESLESKSNIPDADLF